MFYMPNWPLPHVEYAQGAIVFVVKLCDQMYKPFLFDKERGGCCLNWEIGSDCTNFDDQHPGGR